MVAILIVVAFVMIHFAKSEEIFSRVSRTFQLGFSSLRDTIKNKDSTTIKAIVTKVSETQVKNLTIKPVESTKKPRPRTYPRIAKLNGRASKTQPNAHPAFILNSTHFGDKVMEPVDANYVENIYFSVKTTNKYHSIRLPLLMLTWLQAVKDKVSI